MENEKQLRPQKLILTLLLSVFTAVYTEMYREGIQYFLTGDYSGFQISDWNGTVLMHTAVYFAASLVFFLILVRFLRPILVFLDRYRFVIAAVIFIVCVIFEISGSSIAYWYGTLTGIHTTGDLRSAGVLFGSPRYIRGDEFGIFTPFNLSQQYNGYNAVSDIVRGSATDVTTLYGAPAWALVTIFRPFYLGYLFLGAARGLSFYWIGRLLALFLVSYEFGKFIAKGNKWLAGAYACILAFSPVVQWWFSTNCLCEMLIFGQGGVLILAQYMKPRKLASRFLLSALLIECLGGFLFAYYPAWEIPVGYIFLLLGLWVILSKRKEFKFSARRDLPFLFGTLLIFAALAGGVLYFSRDAILTTIHTAYPGRRLETGGGDSWRTLLSQFSDILFPIDSKTTNSNPVGLSAVLTLTPVGTFLGIWTLIRRKKDGMIAVLLPLQALFTCYYFITFPEWLARITLLGQSRTHMMILPIGLIDALLLFHSLAILKNEPASRPVPSVSVFAYPIRLILGVLLAAGFAYIAHFQYIKGISLFHMILIFIGILPLCIGLLFITARNGQRTFFLGIAVVLLLSGLAVNPLQKGISAVTDDALISRIREMNAEDPGVWAVTESSYPMNNIPVLAGASDITSSQVYPDLEKWAKVDPTGEYEYDYNRYAHISMKLVSDSTAFTVLAPDQFEVHLSYKDIRTLGINYILSAADYGQTDGLTSGADPILAYVGKTEGFYIYKVK